jgi:GT2 family glycosyltransferase
MASIDSLNASGSEGAVDVSIIIISFNTREILRECLRSVAVATQELRVEILVVDNGSHDGSVEMLTTEFKQVKLICSPTNLGFGAANNLALTQAHGRYFVLLNSDAFLEADALGMAIKHMNQTSDCAVGGARLIGSDGALQPSSRMFHSLSGDLIVLSGLAARFPRSPIFGAFDRTWADPSHSASVDWVPGAFSILRPEAVAKVGMFDPAFFLYYEEVDLCRRMKNAGYSVWYWPDIVVTHIGGESSRQLRTLEFSSKASQVVLWRMRSTLLYYRKHHGIKALGAKWLEVLLYRVTVLRNKASHLERRIERRKHHQVLIHLMRQAWKDTQGGRVSPPRPW